jgi:hypothetical protein
MKDERVVVYEQTSGLYLAHNGRKQPLLKYRRPYANKQTAKKAIEKVSVKHPGDYQILAY